VRGFHGEDRPIKGRATGIGRSVIDQRKLEALDRRITILLQRRIEAGSQDSLEEFDRIDDELSALRIKRVELVTQGKEAHSE